MARDRAAERGKCHLVLLVKAGRLLLDATTIKPVVLWTAGDDDDEIFFGVISGLDVDEQGRVYVADAVIN